MEVEDPQYFLSVDEPPHCHQSMSILLQIMMVMVAIFMLPAIYHPMLECSSLCLCEFYVQFCLTMHNHFMTLTIVGRIGRDCGCLFNPLCVSYFQSSTQKHSCNGAL
jgi:hypothetical protein